MTLGPVTHDHPAPQSEDDGRRRMRAGAAKVALDIKRKGYYGVGLRAQDMAHGHNERTLERWARQPGAPALQTMTIDPTHPKAAQWPS